MFNISSSKFFIAIPELYLFTIAFFILFVGLFSKNSESSFNITKFNVLYSLTILSVIFSGLLAYFIGGIYIDTFNSLYVLSPTIYVFKIILILFTLIILVLSRGYIIDKGLVKFEYLFLILFLLGGTLLMISSNDFISFYVTLELTTICTYILMFINRKNISSFQVGIKYFLLGALGTAFLLYGISLIYGYTGLTNFYEIRSYLTSDSYNLVLLLGIVMFLVGISFKLSLVPFHLWTADVYQGVNKFILLQLSIITKFSILFVLVKILWVPFIHIIDQWNQIIYLLIILSSILGSIAFIYHTNIHALIAYSSIANMGYVLVIALSPSVVSMKYFIIYIITYGISLIGFISSIMMFKKDNKEIQNIYDLKGLYKYHPYMSFVLTVFILSMAGLPIMSGFFGKIIVLYSVFLTEHYVLGTIVALFTVIMMYGYLKIIKIIYFDSYEDIVIDYYSYKNDIYSKILLTSLFIFTLLFIVFLYPITNFLEQTLVLF